MYEKFYHLETSPFGLSPDPRFFFPTPSHNEALAAVSYGVGQRKGFVIVTGEVGTGKTLILRYTLDVFSRKNTTFAFVPNPCLPPVDFLSYVLMDLKIQPGNRSKGEMLIALNEHLLTRSRAGATTAMIVDEAHLLTTELLEEIRLLTNLETSQHKLLQLVLVGQPELDTRLDSAELRQLKQRVTLRCRLRPLELVELFSYVRRRLQIAGAGSHADTIFPDETIVEIFRFSGGIPRVVNNLCENALIYGVAGQFEQIPPEIVRDVAADLALIACNVGNPVEPLSGSVIESVAPMSQSISS